MDLNAALGSLMTNFGQVKSKFELFNLKPAAAADQIDNEDEHADDEDSDERDI